MGKTDDIFYVQAFVLLHQGKQKEGHQNEDMLLQTLTRPAELAVPTTLAVRPIYPPLPPPSFPFQPQFLTLGLGTSPPSRAQLENPVLVSGAQGLGLVSPPKAQQGSQFGPRATPRAGQLPLLLLCIGG